MKVSVAEDHGIVFEDVYSGFTMRTSEGNEIHICMRDDTFEINVCPKGADIQNWKRVNMQTGKIVDVKEESDKYFKEKNLKDDSVDCLSVAMLKNDIFNTGTSEEIKKHWMQSDQKMEYKVEKEKRFEKSFPKKEPNPTVQKCHIIYMESIVDMNDAINAYLKAGWKMEGELGTSDWFTQKMVREEEE